MEEDPLPKGWRTAEIITSTTSARDRAAVPTTARSGRMGGCVMPPHRSMRHRHALTFPSDRRPPSLSWDQCESAQRGGEPSPPEPQRKADRAGEARTASDGGGLLQGATGPGTDDGGIRQRSHGIPGGQAPLFMDAGHPAERLRLRLGWTPRSSKPSLILLYAGKDDAGALDAYLHAYNPAFSEYIWAVDIRRKGGDLGQDCWARSLTRWPQLQDVEHPQVVPQTGWPTLRGLEDLEPRVMEDTDNDSVLMLRQMWG